MVFNSFLLNLNENKKSLKKIKKVVDKRKTLGYNAAHSIKRKKLLDKVKKTRIDARTVVGTVIY